MGGKNRQEVRHVARMPVPKMVKNGFNSVLVVSAVFRVDRYS